MSSELPKCLVCLAMRNNKENQRYAAGWFNWYEWLRKANPTKVPHDCGTHDVEMAAELLRRDA